MSRIHLAFPVAFLALATAACSSSSNNSPEGGIEEDTGNGKHDTGTGTQHDAGTEAGKKHDGGTVADSGFDASDALPPGPAPAPGSTQLVSGTTVLLGVTDDGNLIYTNGAASNLYALSYLTSGAKPTLILAGSADASATNSPLIGINHNIVFAITNYNTHTVGTVQIWSAAHPTLTTISTSSTGVNGVSNDSSLVTFTDQSNTNGTIGNLVGVNGDGSSPTTLLKSIDIDDTTGGTCPPAVVFDQGYAVVQACPIQDGGTTGFDAITAFNGKSAWSSVLLEGNSLPTTTFLHYAVDDAGLNALTFGQTLLDGGDAIEKLSIVNLATGVGTVLTPNGGPVPSTQVPGGTPAAFLNGSSTFALFSVFNNGLSRATFVDPALPVPVEQVIVPAVDGGAATTSVGGVEAVSPDNNWAFTFGTDLESTLSLPTSLYLQSLTQTAGAFPAPISLSTNSTVYILGFSADGTYVIYSTDATSNGIEAPEPSAGFIGTLVTAKLAAGSTPVTINAAQTIWDASGTHGTALIYNWNYQAYGLDGNPVGSGFNGSAYADIYSGDATMASEGKILVGQADANYYLSNDKTKLIYSFTKAESTDGVYIVPVP